MSNSLTKKKSTAIKESKPITLNRDKRKILISILPKVIDMSSEQKLYDGFIKLFKDLLTKEVRENFPLEDMEILKKYNCAIETSSYSLVPDGDSRSQSFIIDQTLLPRSYYDIPNSIKKVSSNLEKMAKKTIIMKKQLEIEKIKKISAYTALIHTSKTIDDLKSVWLDVENIIAKHLKGNPDIRVKIQGVFSKEDAKIVIKDVKERTDSNE